jgi:hypothetical protein
MLHWTAGDYLTTFSAYHFCLTGALAVRVHATHDLRANMRDLRRESSGDYAAHTAGRNSFSVGIAICAMRGATPHDFADYPLTPDQVEALCLVAARIAAFYEIALDAIRTHAEAALDDGYFGAGDDEVRWDIARLEPRAAPLAPVEAAAVGARLRERISALC